MDTSISSLNLLLARDSRPAWPVAVAQGERPRS